jgi:hypothetical protein
VEAEKTLVETFENPDDLAVDPQIMADQHIPQSPTQFLS